MKTCDQCFWSDECFSETICPHFTPMTEDIDEVIEVRKSEFLQEWYDYVYDYEE